MNTPGISFASRPSQMSCPHHFYLFSPPTPFLYLLKSHYLSKTFISGSGKCSHPPLSSLPTSHRKYERDLVFLTFSVFHFSRKKFPRLLALISIAVIHLPWFHLYSTLSIGLFCLSRYLSSEPMSPSWSLCVTHYLMFLRS